MNGHGVYHWKEGTTYAGDWLNSKMHGMGEYKWTDGRVYSG